MPRFKYKAKNQSGKTVVGEQFASSRKKLAGELHAKNLTVISATEVLKNDAGFLQRIFSAPMGGHQKIKTFDLAVFCRQLATMVEGGIPILRAIESITSEVRNRRFRDVLGYMAQDLRDGKKLSDTFKNYPDAFPVLFTAIIEAGEESGGLDVMLRRLAGYLEAKDRLARKMRTATAYPAFITVFFLGVLTVVTIFFIPRFQAVYQSFDAELPRLTEVVFGISNFAVRNFYPISLCVILAVVLPSFFAKRTRTVRLFFNKMLLRLPIFGGPIKKAAVCKFCRTLSTLLSQSVPVTEALFLVGKTSGNLVIEEASKKASKLVNDGETIPAALYKTRVFPPLMMQMVAVGDESGALPELLDKTADFYEEQVDIFVSTLTATVEPILISLLGFVIAIVVAALYLPIFKLGTLLN